MANEGVQVIRLPDLGPIQTSPRPLSGGALIYCASDSGNFGSSGTYMEASLPLVLTQRSTVNIQIIFQTSGTAVWFVEDPGRRGDARVISPQGGDITTAITRDAGEWPIVASVTGATYENLIMIVAVVGSNTEDDCVTYGYGT